MFFRKSENERIVQFDLAAFYTLRDGLITEIREILDSFDLVQQILERDVAAVLTGMPGEISDPLPSRDRESNRFFDFFCYRM